MFYTDESLSYEQYIFGLYLWRIISIPVIESYSHGMRKTLSSISEWHSRQDEAEQLDSINERTSARGGIVDYSVSMWKSLWIIHSLNAVFEYIFDTVISLCSLATNVLWGLVVCLHVSDKTSATTGFDCGAWFSVDATCWLRRGISPFRRHVLEQDVLVWTASSIRSIDLRLCMRVMSKTRSVYNFESFIPNEDETNGSSCQFLASSSDALMLRMR